jgi:hypothetical protein
MAREKEPAKELVAELVEQQLFLLPKLSELNAKAHVTFYLPHGAVVALDTGTMNVDDVQKLVLTIAVAGEAYLVLVTQQACVTEFIDDRDVEVGTALSVIAFNPDCSGYIRMVKLDGDRVVDEMPLQRLLRPLTDHAVVMPWAKPLAVHRLNQAETSRMTKQ